MRRPGGRLGTFMLLLEAADRLAGHSRTRPANFSGNAPTARRCCAPNPGLGFLINDDIQRPLLIAFLLIAILGLALGMRHHGSPPAAIIGVLGVVTVYASINTFCNNVLAVIGIVGLVIASLLNVFLRQ